MIAIESKSETNVTEKHIIEIIIRKFVWLGFTGNISKKIFAWMTKMFVCSQRRNRKQIFPKSSDKIAKALYSL